MTWKSRREFEKRKSVAALKKCFFFLKQGKSEPFFKMRPLKMCVLGKIMASSFSIFEVAVRQNIKLRTERKVEAQISVELKGRRIVRERRTMQTIAGGSCGGEPLAYVRIQLHYELDYHLNGNKREMLKYTILCVYSISLLYSFTPSLSLSLYIFSRQNGMNPLSSIIGMQIGILLYICFLFFFHCFDGQIRHWENIDIFKKSL